MYDVRFSFY